MKKIIITIILFNIKITIIQTIILQFENMMHLFCISLKKTLCNWGQIFSKKNNNIFQSKILINCTAALPHLCPCFGHHAARAVSTLFRPVLSLHLFLVYPNQRFMYTNTYRMVILPSHINITAQTGTPGLVFVRNPFLCSVFRVV